MNWDRIYIKNERRIQVLGAMKPMIIGIMEKAIKITIKMAISQCTLKNGLTSVKVVRQRFG